MEDSRGDAATDPFDALLERAARLSPLPPSDHPRLHPGRDLVAGRLQLRHRLGAGGMGVVYEAFDRERGGAVALKTLSRLDATSIYRFKNEFRALSEVTHPNLVRLYELFTDGEMWLFTMEVVVGEAFDLWVRPQGELDEARLRHALGQLAAGVQAIHAVGKLHRDLKPSNVLVTAEGRLVILDFGLVSDPEPGGEGQTLAEERVLGTPAYMAPEQARAKGATSASDWYAVGVMLFEALTGALPFDGRTYEILWRKQHDAAPPASSCMPGVPSDLDALCSALLTRDAKSRPLGAQIEALVHTGGPPAPSASTAPGPLQPSELVGRTAELHALRAALHAAESGQATVVRVLGESGVGKSALVGVFREELQGRERVVVLAGGCYERESVPYKAFDRVVDALSRHLLRQPKADVAALLPRDAGTLARLFPVLGRVTAIANAPLRAAADDQEVRRRAFQAFAELLARIRDHVVLVIHMDDVQWIDHDSVMLLEHLLSQPDPVPLLLLISYRASGPGDALLERVQRAAHANPNVTLCDLVLQPLSLDDATELACRRLSSQPNEREFGAALAAEARGNPFLVCELSRHAAACGPGANRTSVTLEQAIAGRVAGLGNGARGLLELLAVSGRPTPSAVLGHCAGTLDDAHRWLDELSAAQLVRASGTRMRECYHDRIRTAVSDSLAPTVTRDYHARLAAAYEHGEHADPEVLFEHFLAADQRQRAAEHAVAAANFAATSLAFERSAVFLGHAIELLPAAEVQRLGLRERRAEALSLCGRWADSALAFDDAAQHELDAGRHMHLLHRSAAHFLGSGRSSQGLPRLRLVLQAAGIRWPRTRVGAFAGAAGRLLWLWWTGAGPHASAMDTAEATALDPGQSPPKYERLLDAAALVPPYDLARGLYFMSVYATFALRSAQVPRAAVAVALGMLAGLFATLPFGVTSSRRWAAQASALCRISHLPAWTCSALSFVSSARLLDGRLREALELANEAEHVLSGSERENFYQSWTARALQGFALFALGRVGEAAQRFAENARRAREVGNDLAVVSGGSVLQYLAFDDVEGARRLLDQKELALAAAGSQGVMRETVALDRILFALYEGRGPQLLQDQPRGGASLLFFDSAPLLACCALQGPRDARARRAVTRALRTLRGRDAAPDKQGTAAQLRAALRLIDGDPSGARTELALAAEHYAAADMLVHAALMRLREGKLRGDAEGELNAQEAARLMLSLGITAPAAWARMVAPGLEAG